MYRDYRYRWYIYRSIVLGPMQFGGTKFTYVLGGFWSIFTGQFLILFCHIFHFHPHIFYVCLIITRIITEHMHNNNTQSTINITTLCQQKRKSKRVIRKIWKKGEIWGKVSYAERCREEKRHSLKVCHIH